MKIIKLIGGLILFFLVASFLAELDNTQLRDKAMYQSTWVTSTGEKNEWPIWRSLNKTYNPIYLRDCNEQMKYKHLEQSVYAVWCGTKESDGKYFIAYTAIEKATGPYKTWNKVLEETF